jgi:hypothetical protein
MSNIEMGDECVEYKNLAFLLVSLGITVILVGALFYYVRQRFEVLEVSHKEQIGVMRNFISSIGEQFQRMSMTRPTPHPEHPENNTIALQRQEQEQGQEQDHHEDRISISEDSDDDYDDDSESSDTDVMDAYRISGSNNIVFCNDDDDNDDASDKDIKIIELCDTRENHPNNNDNESDESDENDESDESESDDDDGDDDDDSESNISDNDNNAPDTKRLIVIKTDNVAPEEVIMENINTSDTHHGRGDRNMVIDLDLDTVDLLSGTNAADTATTIAPTTAATESAPSYAQMSIKQLRQSVKRINEHKHLDTSKLKRDQLIAMLG